MVSKAEKIKGGNTALEGDEVQVEMGVKSISTFRALLWKNFTLKRKRRRSTCCEFSVPTLFIFLIIVLKGLTAIEEIPRGWSEDFIEQCPYTDRNATSLLVQVPCPVPYETFIIFPDNFQRFFSFLSGRDNRTPFGRFCLAHSGKKREIDALEDFINFVETTGITASGPQPQIRDAIFFEGTGTEEELLEYLQNPDYGLPFSDAAPECVVGLVFNEMDYEKAQFTYTIRGNATFDVVYFEVPETTREAVEFERFIDSDDEEDYAEEGFWNLQALVDSFIIKQSFANYKSFPMKVDVNNRKVQKEHDFFTIGKFEAVLMPIEEFTRDIFFTLVQEILPLIFVVVYLMPVSQIIAVIVLEKEVRAREMMRLMGVSDFKIISSWYVTYIIFFAIIALFFTLGGGLMFPSTTSAAGGFSLTIFFIFFSFGLSALAFSFVVSTFFKKSFNAVVFGLMTYIILFFLFYFFNERFDIPTAPLLIPQIAFGFTIQTLSIFEETGVGVSGELVSTDLLGFNVLRGIMMMLFDAFYLTLLGFYFNAVIPGEFGTALPFYFPCVPEYWKKFFTRTSPEGEMGEVRFETLKVLNGKTIEEPTEALKNQVTSGVGIQMRGLTKKFQTPDGEKVAVNNLSLDVFEGQILVLLGHNGAGKTTTLQMLTGSLFMTGGEAYIYGNRVRTDMGLIRKSLGFCPQHDVLYKELTVYDHLKFYGKVKDVDGEELERDIDESLLQVGLTEKKFVKSKNLSGGMKRKLSLAISLIGNSKVIFVDEPTSGVDTFSRRSMWEILQNARENRVIILTTHFMDEADLLGDRIAIMAEGELQCVGSSLFLKQLYGAGYRLVFTKKEGCSSDSIQDLIFKHVPSAVKSSDVGTELSFQLPINESQNFAPLFGEVDDLIDSGELLIANYGVSVTTMEEVFLKAGQSEDLLEGANNYGEANIDEDKKDSFIDGEDTILVSTPLLKFWRQFTAMFIKRVHYAKRDRYAFVCNTLVPVTIFCFGLMVLTFTDAFDDPPPLVLNVDDLNTDFSRNARAFLPIIEITSVDQLSFEEGRFAQQELFDVFNLERPFVNRTEFPGGNRTVFTQTYKDGQTNDCREPIDCDNEIRAEDGELVLDFGEALLNPDNQFQAQIATRNGASLFAAAIINPAEESQDEGGCFLAEFGINLNTGFTIESQSVQCSDRNSPCVMVEVTLENFFGNNFFTCIPGGCLSDFNEDIVNFLLAVAGQGVDGESDVELVQELAEETKVFICEDSLCNLAPASLDDFSICRGGAAFEEDLCVIDSFIALDTEVTLNAQNDALEDLEIDIDFDAEYCEGRDVSGLDISDFIDEEDIFVPPERQLQNATSKTCLRTTSEEDIEVLIALQQDVESAEAVTSFQSRDLVCVDENLVCEATVAAISEEVALCIVQSCLSDSERFDLTNAITGSESFTNTILSTLDDFEKIACVEIPNRCAQVLDYSSDVAILGALIDNDSFETLLNSTLFDNVVDFLLDTLNLTIGNGPELSLPFSRTLQEVTAQTLEELLLELSSLSDAELSLLTSLVNNFLGTSFDPEDLSGLFAIVLDNLQVVELLVVQPEIFTNILVGSLNSADNEEVICGDPTDSCLLVEQDLNFGLVCVPAGCSSDFFELSSPRTLLTSSDETFNGITTVFECTDDNCNNQCKEPTNCDSDTLFPVEVDESNEELIRNEDLCKTFRIQYTLLPNTTATHILPIAANELHNAILKRSLIEYFDFESEELRDSFTLNSNLDSFGARDGGEFGNLSVRFEFPNKGDAPRITVITHPMPFPQSTQEIFEAIIAFTTAVFCLLAYAFIPAPMISYVVMEKEEDVQLKHLQFVSGAGVFAYWCSNYLFDILSFLIPFFLSLLLILFFQVDTFIENGAFEVVAIALFGYGLAIIPFSYLIGHLFKKHTSALIWIIIINCLLGLTLMIASFAMDQVPETVDINSDLKWIYRFSPGFCLGDSLLNIAITSLTIGLLGEEESPNFYDRDVAGANIRYLYLESVGFFLLVVFIEYSKTTPLLAKYLNFQYLKRKMFANSVITGENENYEIDEDVKRETERVLNAESYKPKNKADEVESGVKEDVLKMLNLRKVYGNGKVAVKGVSLGIPEGECFGYLGINGAGKTSTLKCLTGDVFPTSGDGFINGYSIVTEQWSVRRHIGYCSQFSSILGLLTVREHLELFCRIKEVADVEGTVQKLIKRLSLTPFENKLSMRLSGGNKRKLSVGIAMIGSPKVMLLDEPSTGMDVASRRFMWNVIENMVNGNYDGKKTSVVLTTHSMEECEALCSRVGIMVGGRLRCLGSIQHLKSRFGTGYTLETKLEYITKEEVQAILSMKGLNENVFVTQNNLYEFVSDLDEKAAVKRLEENPNGIAWSVKSKLNHGGIKPSVLIEWILQQQRIITLETFLGEVFEDLSLVESHDYQVTYRIDKTEGVRLSTIFDAIEQNKENLHISEYAVSQTTLEQIFNGFAAQQEEEKATPRGVATL